MIHGMTAFGHAEKEYNGWKISVDISSVNRRYLEIVCKLPTEYSSLEAYFRSVLQEHVVRGQLTITVQLQFLAADPFPLKESKNISVSWEYVDLCTQFYKELAKKNNVLLSDNDLFTCLVQHTPYFVGGFKQASSVGPCSAGLHIDQSSSCHEPLKKDSAISQEKRLQKGEDSIKEVFCRAFDIFIARRKKEGEFIQAQLQTSLDTIFELVEKIKKDVGSQECQIELHTSKLQKILAPYVSSDLLFDDRMTREIVLVVNKCDIFEEMSRLEHHISSFQQGMDGKKSKNNEVKKEGRGKMLEFWLQEILRECNTLGAKTTQCNVSTCVVLAKTEIEKMREQVQNVE